MGPERGRLEKEEEERVLVCRELIYLVERISTAREYPDACAGCRAFAARIPTLLRKYTERRTVARAGGSVIYSHLRVSRMRQDKSRKRWKRSRPALSWLAGRESVRSEHLRRPCLVVWKMMYPGYSQHKKYTEETDCETGGLAKRFDQSVDDDSLFKEPTPGICELDGENDNTLRLRRVDGARVFSNSTLAWDGRTWNDLKVSLQSQGARTFSPFRSEWCCSCLHRPPGPRHYKSLSGPI